jgi:hypothetical protein
MMFSAARPGDDITFSLQADTRSYLSAPHPGHSITKFLWFYHQQQPLVSRDDDSLGSSIPRAIGLRDFCL